MAKAGPRGVLLGFLAIRKTPSEGVRGGYLITTEYGRPVEFHYTTELKLAGPQRLLFGGAAPEYLHVELVAVPLTDKQSVAPQILFVDSPALLELRTRIPAPVVCVSPPSIVGGDGRHLAPVAVRCHPEHPGDAAIFERLRELAPSQFDWLEPFDRLTGALAEIRETRSLAA
ncbi:MAG TPA: hypothetical protein VNC50_21435 [Planctomycetia bacterium]|jgi:hypothetical protein|nr:hypothetical protein [Planctomycetia bacterium]